LLVLAEDSMFRSLLVPLDGTPVAAQALPYVPIIAAPGARITLVGVATPPLDMPGTRAQEADIVAQMERTRAFLWQDLEARAEPLRAHGLHVVTTVRTGDVTAEILTCASEAAADLLVLATHGTSDLARWMLGSSARRLLHATTLPMLVIHASAGLTSADPEFGSVLVPLDGSSLAETPLPVAAELAAQIAVPLRIVRIVPDQALLHQTYAPSDAAAVHRRRVTLEQAYAAAEQYVASRVDRFRNRGCDASGTVHVGDPARALSVVLAEEPSALVIMATHGAGGGDWWTFGSVAEKLAATVPNPMLIVRPLAGKTGGMRHDPVLAARYPD
jgi:nucleotide-binding universal stress UspA family protein